MPEHYSEGCEPTSFIYLEEGADFETRVDHEKEVACWRKTRPSSHEGRGPNASEIGGEGRVYLFPDSYPVFVKPGPKLGT